jgi:tRNA(fMet)-specific endonuclease VapC
MILLDTNHLDILMLGGERSERLVDRLLDSGQPVATTIISVQEKADGWLSAINRHSTQPAVLPRYYEQLHLLVGFFSGWTILPFDDAAVREFRRLQRMRLRVGTMDLRIGSIALCHQALVLTRNVRDFERIPGLRVEDWHPA